LEKIIEFKNYSDIRGNLTTIDDVLPFEIKRVYYIFGEVGQKRGFHKHKKTRQVAVCINGSCKIVFSKNGIETKYILDNPNKGLLIEPDDFHWIEDFSINSILLVLASENYDSNDYIYENND